MSSSVVYPAENRHKKRPICRVEQISLVISCKTRGASSPVCWLCRAAERSAPTTPLLRFMIAYAQPKVNMRAKLLPYANRKADTETAAQAVRCARTAQAVRPVRAGSFAVNHSGELPLRAAGAQEGRQPAVFHPLVNLPFSLLPWVQTVDCVSRKRTRQSGYLSVSFSAFSQFTDRLLLHIPATFRRRGIPVPRLRGVNRLCSSNIAEMRICGYRAEEKILCRSPISQRSHVGNLRQTIQGKGVIHKRVETVGVYPLVPPPGRHTPR